MKRLSPETLVDVRPGIATPAYDRAHIATGVVHFGPGAFHRAHQAFFIDRLLETDPRWGIAAVALRHAAIPQALSAQRGLYTVAELAQPPHYRIIGSIREAIAAQADPQAVRAHLSAPTTRVVTATVTEAGYIAPDPANPTASLIGWLVEGLRLRRAAKLPPFTAISCDNLSGNGARLRNGVLQFAGHIDPDLASWIEAEARFPNTMVDSITPAGDGALKARVAEAIGLADEAPVQREPFVQWVMDATGPDWSAAGVIRTTDIAGYEQAKLRILNGAHSTLAYLGLLRGRKTTRDAMADPMLATFVRRLVCEDIVPGITPPGGLDLAAYSESVLTRIANPAIEHQLAQIAYDGSQKLPIRLAPSIEAALRTGRPLDRLAVPIAAWLRFLRRRAREGIAIVDPLAERLTALARTATGEGPNDVMLFAEFLPPIDPTFIAALARAYDTIGDRGALPGDGW